MSIIKTPVQLEVKNYAKKGRGICVHDTIREGTIIESLPVLIIDPYIYNKVKELPFINHTFVWANVELEESGAIGFGFASLCNHSPVPNAFIRKNYATASIDLIALRNILPQEEITIRYNNAFFDVAN